MRITWNYVMHSTVLDQQRTIQDIIASLETHHVVGVVGGPGTGKSYTARLLSEHWQKYQGEAAVAAGDEYQKARQFFPFYQAITKFNIEREFFTRTATGALVRTASSIPIAGPLAGYVIERMFSRSQSVTKDRYSYLSAEEQNILYQLQHITAKKRFLLVCDDLQAWDGASLSLLRLLLSRKLSSAYTFLREARVVLIRTAMNTDEEPRFEDIVDDGVSIPVWRLGYVAKEHFSETLRVLGLQRELPPDVLNAIYAICGGHLHIARQLVEYLEREDYPISRRWIGADGSRLVFKLVETRLKDFGSWGEQLLNLLSIAATIGNVFSEQELACLSGRDLSEVRDLLSKGEGLRLVRREPMFVYFAHSILLDGLKEARASQSKELHRQFAACLKKLRPGDYRSRSFNWQQAGDYEDAAVLAVCSHLHDQRRGIALRDGDETKALIDAAGLGVALATLKRAYDLAQGYDLDEAMRLLAGVDPTLPTLLRAEADYIRAMCLIKRYRYDTREQAIKIIRRWTDKLQDEEELVVRLRSTELVALAHQRRSEDAMGTEAALVDILRKRLTYDPDARDALVVLDRKADLLYPADQAYHRLLRAKTYFMPQNGSPPRNFYQYCASTLNLAANRIMCGAYDEALIHLREITAFLEQNPNHSFARLEVLSNNLIVAELRSNVYDASIAAAHFEALVERVLDTMDYSLEISNCGACWALANDLQKARIILSSVVANLDRSPEADDYHRYFAGSNLASVLHLLGDTEQAIRIFEPLGNILDAVNPPHKVYFRRRHEILLQAIKQKSELSPAMWDSLPITKEPLGAGPGWRHYGRGFLLSDIQIWTES